MNYGAPDALNPTDQVLFSKHLLEASLIGIPLISLFCP